MKHFFQIKSILFQVILFLALQARANDTLTRVQIYNFNVGDTFDYSNYTSYNNSLDTTHNFATFTYTRFVVSSVYRSVDTLTKYIVRNRVYPGPVTSDTLTLTGLDSIEVVLDSSGAYLHPVYIRIDSAPVFFGKTTNYLQFSFTYPGGGELHFGRGLGKVKDYNYSGGAGGFLTNSVTLIYYSGTNGKLGTPYTSLLNSLTEMPAEQAVKIFPNPNHGKFNVELPDGIDWPLHFFVYDVQGKNAGQYFLTGGLNRVELPGLTGGLYFWKAASADNFLGVGKMVVW